jgi:hypothetical protein
VPARREFRVRGHDLSNQRAGQRSLRCGRFPLCGGGADEKPSDQDEPQAVEITDGERLDGAERHRDHAEDLARAGRASLGTLSVAVAPLQDGP